MKCKRHLLSTKQVFDTPTKLNYTSRIGLMQVRLGWNRPSVEFDVYICLMIQDVLLLNVCRLRLGWQ